MCSVDRKYPPLGPWFRVLHLQTTDQKSCGSTAKRPRRLSADVDACGHDMEAFGVGLITVALRERPSVLVNIPIKCAAANVNTSESASSTLHASLRFTKGRTISYSGAGS